MQEFIRLLQHDIPLQLRHDLILLYTDDLEEAKSVSKETSLTLSSKCQLLYLLSLLSSPDDEICVTLLTTVTLPLLQDVTFQARFPIHEKYHSVLYLMLRQHVIQIVGAGLYG